MFIFDSMYVTTAMLTIKYINIVGHTIYYVNERVNWSEIKTNQI